MKLKELINNKRVLIIPNCSDLEHPKENRNVLTWTVFKFLKLAESQQVKAKSATFNQNHNFDVIIASWVGDDLEKISHPLHKLRGSGHTIFEYAWCNINSMFFLQRVSYNGRSEDISEVDTNKPGHVNEKKHILSFDVGTFTD